MPTDEVCGVILAGGKSLRMGRDKALLEVHGQSLIARAASVLSSVSDEIVVSANDPTPYTSLGLQVIADAYPGQGPLAGLHAVMTWTRRPLVLLLACDLPRVHSRMLARLIELSEGFDMVIPQTADGGFHPLSAIYRRTCLPFIEAVLIQQVNKMTAFLANSPLRARWLTSTEGFFADSDLINLNSPNDLFEYTSGGDFKDEPRRPRRPQS